MKGTPKATASAAPSRSPRRHALCHSRHSSHKFPARRIAVRIGSPRFGDHAYDALMIAIEQTKGFVGTSGTFDMSLTDHMGLDLSAFRMLEVKNGGWSLVQ